MNSRPSPKWWVLPISVGAYCVAALLDRRRPRPTSTPSQNFLIHRRPLPRSVPVLLLCLALDSAIYVVQTLGQRLAPFLKWHPENTLEAFRFHFGALILALPSRRARMALMGMTAVRFRLWQSLFLSSLVYRHPRPASGLGLWGHLNGAPKLLR